MTGLNPFLRAVRDGDHQRVRALLKRSKKKQPKMCENKSHGGYIAARIALENNDEEMFDMLLPKTKYKELFEGALDDVSVFEKALSINPAWIDKFDQLSDEPRVSFLFTAMNIADLDDEERFAPLWNEMCHCKVMFAHFMITRAITKRHFKLSEKLVNAHLDKISDRNLNTMARAAVEYRNIPVMKLLFPRLKAAKTDTDVFQLIIRENNLDMFQELAKLDWPLTERHLYSLGRSDVKISTVKAVLDTGAFVKNLHFPKDEMEPVKFGVLAEAGFFIAAEQLYLRTPRENTEFPTLRALAVTGVREALTNAQNSNLRHIIICKKKLKDWPRELVDNTAHPGFDWMYVKDAWWELWEPHW